MSSAKSFDYLIIGGGLAGLQLALVLSTDSFFKSKSIGIIEPEEKNINDKTWCFWEKGKGIWDHLLTHQWEKGVFKTSEAELPLSMKNYAYKMIRSADFYAFAKGELTSNSEVTWIKDEIIGIEKNHCQGKKESYHGVEVFDSRIPKEFFEDTKHIHIKQPFKGWVIETEDNCFDPESFTMMDYSLKYEDKCCFTYVLPTSKRRALIEFTFFVPELVDDSVYDELLKSYVETNLGIQSYKIKEVEKGIVPMSTFPFWEKNKDHFLKIGTGGGWVKASSGYSFKNTERKITKVIENLKANKKSNSGLFSKRHRFFDRIMLRVLQDENEIGSKIFEEMYTQNSTAQIFKFLDEETNFVEDLKIINSFNKAPFLRSLLKEIK